MLFVQNTGEAQGFSADAGALPSRPGFTCSQQGSAPAQHLPRPAAAQPELREEAEAEAAPGLSEPPLPSFQVRPASEADQRCQMLHSPPEPRPQGIEGTADCRPNLQHMEWLSTRRGTRHCGWMKAHGCGREKDAPHEMRPRPNPQSLHMAPYLENGSLQMRLN